jgi:hypothetical protein
MGKRGKREAAKRKSQNGSPLFLLSHFPLFPTLGPCFRFHAFPISAFL